jgi:hypothetical protein
VRAYKFTLPGAIGPITGFEWPQPAAAGGAPGPWVHTTGADPCQVGVHACRVAQLPYWLGVELWELELAGELVVDAHKVVASSGRLVRRVDEWSAAVQREFASWCAVRTRRLVTSGSGPLVDALAGYAQDAEAAAAAGHAPGAAQVSAIAAGDASLGRIAHDETSPGYLTERAEQARWLQTRLALTDGATPSSGRPRASSPGTRRADRP